MRTLTMDEVAVVSGADCSSAGATITAVAGGVALAAGVVALIPGGQPVAAGWGIAGLATSFVGGVVSALGANGVC